MFPNVFFDTETGKPYKDIKQSFSAACRQAGIHDFHFHHLRHTFASYLVEFESERVMRGFVVSRFSSTCLKKYWRFAIIVRILLKIIAAET
jgi:integrase